MSAPMELACDAFDFDYHVIGGITATASNVIQHHDLPGPQDTFLAARTPWPSSSMVSGDLFTQRSPSEASAFSSSPAPAASST
jgi:hypothetical protein